MTALPGLRPDTKFSGECQHCRAAGHRGMQTYTPLPGRSAQAPSSDQMNVTCRRCDGPMVLFAHLGQSIRQPLILDRDDIDTSKLRRHVNECHRHARIRGVPRANQALAVWHFRQHWRYHQDHLHFGPFVMIRDSRGSTVGQTPRPLGWYTGQEAKSRAELNAEWRAAHPAIGVRRDTDGTILRGPSLPCGCPLDSGCTGHHPGRLA